MLAKFKRAPLPKGPVPRATTVHYRTFADLSGKMHVRSWNGHYYAAYMLDDCSDFPDVVTFATKDDFHAAYNARN
eukprot:1572289-Rhodomonas_salina.1